MEGDGRVMYHLLRIDESVASLCDAGGPQDTAGAPRRVASMWLNLCPVPPWHRDLDSKTGIPIRLGRPSLTSMTYPVRLRRSYYYYFGTASNCTPLCLDAAFTVARCLRPVKEWWSAGDLARTL